MYVLKKQTRDFPGGAAFSNLPVSAEDMGSVSSPGKFHVPHSN